VLAPERGRLQVVTTDSLIEDVHFRREWTAALDIGHKALAVNLSDLAAMGAAPRAALLSLALPPSLPVADFDALVDGFVSLARRERLPLVGGNLARSPGPLVLDATVVGSVHPRRVLTRGGAKPGDELFLTGAIGAAAAGLAALRAGAEPPGGLDADARACRARYERPEARLTCGIQVARNRAASAAVDLSDGLADAASQIAAASGAGVILEADTLPVHAGARRWADAAGLNPVDFAVEGGEDYELLFAVSRRQRRAFQAIASRCRPLAVTRVGRITAEAGCWLSRAGRLEPLGPGFAHFGTGPETAPRGPSSSA
jgi:thiamine-monophosphate kinase